MFPGIADRMQKELNALSPSGVKVCFAISSDSMSDGLIVILFIFFRSRFWPLQSANILSGLVALFWLLLVLSRMLGALNRSMTRAALGSFIAVRMIIKLKPFGLF